MSCCPIPHVALLPLPQAQPPRGIYRGTRAFRRPTHLYHSLFLPTLTCLRSPVRDLAPPSHQLP